DASADLTLSKAELSRIAADSLQLGDNSSASIEVDNIEAADSANIDLVVLDATKDGSQVSFTNAASNFNSLEVKADDGIIVDVDLSTSIGNMTLEADSDNATDTLDALQIADSLTLSSAGDMQIDTTTAGTIAEGSLTLTADKNLVINDDVVANGVTSLTTDNDQDGEGSFTLAEGQVIDTNEQALEITTQDINLLGSIDVGAARLDLLAQTETDIGIGTYETSQFDLSNDELSRVEATGEVYIGGEQAKSIFIDGLDYENTGDLIIESGASEGNIQFVNTASQLDVNTTLYAQEGVSVVSDVNATQSLVIDADKNGSGAGDLSIGEEATLTLTAGDLLITSNDIDIDGYVKVKAGDISLSSSDGANMALGNSEEGFTLDNQEINHIYTNTLKVGDSTTGSISVDSITQENSDKITEGVVLQATGEGKSISFEGEESVVSALTALADDGIALSSNLRTTTGAIELNANYDESDDSSDKLTIADSKVLQAATDITLSSADKEMSFGKAISLKAGKDINIEDDVLANGPINLYADYNEDAEGILNIADTETVRVVDQTSDHLSKVSGDIVVGEDSDGNAILLDKEGNELSLLSDETISVEKDQVLFSVSNEVSFTVSASEKDATLEIEAGERDYEKGDTIAYLSYAQSSPEAAGYIVKEVLKTEGASVEEGDVLYTLMKDPEYLGFEEGAPEEISVMASEEGILSFLSDLVVGEAPEPSSDILKVKKPILAQFTGRFRFDGTLEGAVIQAQEESLDFVVGDVTSDVTAESKGELQLSTEMKDKLDILLGNVVPDPVYDVDDNLVEVNYNSISNDLAVGEMAYQSDVYVSAADIDLAGTLQVEDTGNIAIVTSTDSTIGLGNIDTEGLDLDNNEISRVLTNNTLSIGDEKSLSISVSGIDYEAEGELRLQALSSDSSINFVDEESAIEATTINLSAKNGLNVAKGLSTTGSLSINTDVDNNGNGDLSLEKDAFIKTNNFNTSITSNDVKLALSGGDTDLFYGFIDEALSLKENGAYVEITRNASNFDAEVLGLKITADKTDSNSASATIVDFKDQAYAAGIEVDVQGDLAYIYLDSGKQWSSSDIGQWVEGNVDGMATITAVDGNKATVLINESFTTTDLDSGNWTLKGEVALASFTEGFVEGQDTLSAGAWSASFKDKAEQGRGAYLDIGSGDLSLRVSDSGSVLLGGAEGASADYTISTPELSNIYANNLDFIGDSSKDITISQVNASASQHIDDTLNIQANSSKSSIVFSDGLSEFNQLTIESKGAIAINSDLASTEADINLTVNGTSSKSSISFGDGYTLSSANDINLNSTVNESTFNASFKIEADNDINLNGQYTVSSDANLTLEAERDINLTESSQLRHEGESSSSYVNLSASEVNLKGSLDAGSASVSIAPIDNGDIYLGNLGEEGLNLSRGDLSNISASNLDIGSSKSGNIYVDNVRKGDSDEIAQVNLVATKSDKAIEFGDNGAVFKALSATSDATLSVATNVTTTEGHLELISENGEISLSDQVQLSSGDDLSLTSESSFIEALGDIALSAVDHIKLYSDFDADGSISIQADENNDTIGELYLASGKAMTSNNHDIHVSAADLVLDGSINSGTGELKVGATGEGMAIADAVGQMHISQEELDKLRSRTSLVLGDESTESITINAMDYSGIGELTIMAKGASNGSVYFEEGHSIIRGPLNIFASGLINIDSNVTTNGVTTMDSSIFNINYPKTLDTRGIDYDGTYSVYNPAYISADELYILGYIITGDAPLEIEGDVKVALIDSDNSLNDLYATAEVSSESTNTDAGSISVGSLSSSFTGLGSSDQATESVGEEDAFLSILEEATFEELLQLGDVLNQDYNSIVERITEVDIEIEELQMLLEAALDPEEQLRIQGDISFLEQEKDELEEEKEVLERKLGLVEEKVSEEEQGLDS
ncbi:MAG: hypothetical protein L7U87_08070, partial [Chlamydiales bacterium]|nr:hypothetical protein [Chlamydiales bacterium]